MSATSPKPSVVRVADVVFGARAGGAEAQFTYRLEFGAARGDLVLAPLSARPLVGVVVRAYDATEEELGFPLEKLRPIEGLIEGASLPLPLLEMAEHGAAYFLCPLPAAIGPALPPGISEHLTSRWTLDAQALQGLNLALTPLQTEAVALAEQGEGKLELPKSASAALRKAVRLLESKGILNRTTLLRAIPEGKGSPKLYRLTSQDERVERFLHEQGTQKPAHALTLLKLVEAPRAALSLEDIKSLAGVTQAVVKSLIESGLLDSVSLEKAPATAPAPNPDQQRAIERISEAIGKRAARGFLLYGVTGSGKTEVYLRAAAEALRMGRQVLYLVPEIALATQAIGHLRARFGSKAAVLHSELSPKERLSSWLRIEQAEAPVVIGARSALFAPLSNLGLIVMDEEHESSYKQESSPRYHAKELAKFLSTRHGCPLVFGSATPSIESFHEAQAGALELLELPHRAARALLPEVEIVDLGQGYRSGAPAMLGDRLQELLRETLDAGNQAILFLNRRAYSPFLICRDCGHFFLCPKCAVSLSYSRRQMRLRCHHCGHVEKPPDVCPKCQGTRLNPFGVGTEKVEEAVKALLPDAVVARLDRDVAQRKGALESILAGFGSGEIQVLVGTQIVAKGLNFPNVTLVGVVAADVSLNIPDFRASERTFQLLSQVAGRAGRGDAPGRVVIQTFNPLHPSVQAAQSHDYRSFFELTLEERRAARYPPFVKLVNIVFSGEGFADVARSSEQAARRLRQALPEAEILGPADCAIERMLNRWRKHVLVKLPREALAAPLGEALEGAALPKVLVVVDVEAHSLM